MPTNSHRMGSDQRESVSNIYRIAKKGKHLRFRKRNQDLPHMLFLSQIITKDDFLLSCYLLDSPV